MTKKVDTWMPLLVDLYLGDTGHLTTEQHGAYLLLLMQAWKKDGVLPNNDAMLATICRMTPAKWRASKDVLLEFFTPTEDGKSLTQKRLSDELRRAKSITEKKAQAGAKGAAKRWGGDSKTDGKTDGTAMAQPLANAWQTASQTDAPTPTPLPSYTPECTHTACAGAPDDEDFAPSTEPDLTGFRPTDGALMCRAMKGKGIFDVSPGNPELLMLIAAGATQAEFEDAAEKAVRKRKGFAYALGIVSKARAEVAEKAKTVHRGAMPQQQPAETAYARQQRELMQAVVPAVAAKAPVAQQSLGEVIDIKALERFNARAIA